MSWVTQIPMKVMKALLLLVCTKEIKFEDKGGIYLQNNGASMGSPFGPVLADIFNEERKTSIIPTLGGSLMKLKRCIDEIFLKSAQWITF